MDTKPSKERLVEGLQSFAAEIDSVPTVRGMRENGPYSPHYYKETFGSWHEALRAAGIQPTHGVEADVERDSLLEDLKRVEKIADRPPRRREVEEHGKYDYGLYDEEFESFVRALEAAGIEPEEKQYRFSSVETPEDKKGSANIEQLRNDGPTIGSKLPQGMSPKDRELGMWKFDMGSGSMQPADPVYYLHEEHAPELVLRRFFQHNPHVLENREPHGMKMAIGKHQPSWKDLGQDLVDELVEDGVGTTAAFEDLVIIRVWEDDTLQYCFDASIAELIGPAKLPIIDEIGGEARPVWGFSREYETLWQSLSERDGLLFSTEPGVFTHYVPVAETVENSDVMTELWVEYEDGVRSGGIESPWPYIVLGEEVREVTLSEREFTDEFDLRLTDEPIQSLNEAAVKSVLNSYGSFDSYLRERERSDDTSPSGIGIDEDPSVQDVVDVLLQVTETDLPVLEEQGAFAEIKRATRDEAFREGIYEIYPGCAICGELFESPEGNLDLEAAHILPKAENGPDILQNGLGLCSRHH
jgi:hypothetical protein